MRDEKRKLGARHHNLENFEKKRKKFLTSSTRCDRITELLARAATRKITSKKFEKARKKFLTNDFECDIIQKLSSESTSVPCKLNNVKTIFNTLDNYGLFKRKRKNSQRKFLSNIARSKLFKNLILELRL